MKIQGIIKDNTVQLPKAITIPDGTEVTVEISDRPKMTEEQKKEKIKSEVNI
jgi:hypothetical protein